MTITDATLNEAMKRLTAEERRALEAHMRGEKTPESFHALRNLRRKLKRKVRARVSKLKWLA